MKKFVLAIFIAMLSTVGASAQSTNPLDYSGELYADYLDVFTTPRYVSYEDHADLSLKKKSQANLKCKFDFEYNFDIYKFFGIIPDVYEKCILWFGICGK